jgi:glycosyltransferase involved in cell wall biosynthesis
MKILILGSGSLRSMLTYRALTLGTKLGLRGQFVSLMVPSADKYNDFRREAITELNGVKIIQPWQPTTRQPMVNLLPYLVTSMLKLMTERYDLIYLYKPTPITILGLLPKLIFRTSVILDLDDQGSEVMRGEGRSQFEWRLVAICERLAIRQATAVVVTSRFLSDYVHLVAPNKPILILPNGVDPSDWEERHVTPPRPHVFYFGYVNRLSLIEPLIKAFPQVLAAAPTARLTIIGGGSALEAAAALAKVLGIDMAVTFTGQIPMRDAIKYTHFGDLAVCYQPDIATVRAASNMKVFQYMAMSTVPVVSDVGDLPLYLHNESAGLVVAPSNPSALASGLISLIKDPDRRTKLALTARSLAETTYSWETLTTGLEAFITPQLRGKRSRRNRDEDE